MSEETLKAAHDAAVAALDSLVLELLRSSEKSKHRRIQDICRMQTSLQEMGAARLADFVCREQDIGDINIDAPAAGFLRPRDNGGPMEQMRELVALLKPTAQDQGRMHRSAELRNLVEAREALRTTPTNKTLRLQLTEKIDELTKEITRGGGDALVPAVVPWRHPAEGDRGQDGAPRGGDDAFGGRGAQEAPR